MLDEFFKALGPWPFLQVLFGALIFCAGIYAVIRGAQKGNKETTLALEDKRAEWEALQSVKEIREELRQQTELLRAIGNQIHSNAEAMRALSAILYNENQWPKR